MSNPFSLRQGVPLPVSVLAGAIVLAFVGYQILSPESQMQAVYAFAIIPARFEASSQYHFTSWYEALGPVLGHVFLHGGWAHLGMNMLGYLQASPFLARRIGGGRFVLLFFLSAIGGAVAYVLINSSSESPAVGASGAICGVFGAYFLAVRPTPKEALADPQVRNAVIMFLGVNVVLMGVLAATHVLPIAWEAHLGGFIVGGLAFLGLAPRRSATGPWG